MLVGFERLGGSESKGDCGEGEGKGRKGKTGAERNG
jgi:hypothetical protein